MTPPKSAARSSLISGMIKLGSRVWGSLGGRRKNLAPPAPKKAPIRPPVSRLSDISGKLGASPMVPAHPDAEWKKAFGELLDYCESSRDIRKVMEEFGADRKQLSEIFVTLIGAGAGLWAGGHLVAASSIATPHTLRFLLTHKLSGFDAAHEASYRLIQYFEKGTPLT